MHIFTDIITIHNIGNIDIKNSFRQIIRGDYLMNCMLSTLMGKHRYSIQDVHEKTGLSRNTVSNLYNDKATRVDYETVERLCKLFSCQINDLFEITGQ